MLQLAKEIREDQRTLPTTKGAGLDGICFSTFLMLQKYIWGAVANLVFQHRLIPHWMSKSCSFENWNSVLRGNLTHSPKVATKENCGWHIVRASRGLPENLHQLMSLGMTSLQNSWWTNELVWVLCKAEGVTPLSVRVSVKWLSNDSPVFYSHWLAWKNNSYPDLMSHTV